MPYALNFKSEDLLNYIHSYGVKVLSKINFRNYIENYTSIDVNRHTYPTKMMTLNYMIWLMSTKTYSFQNL